MNHGFMQKLQAQKDQGRGLGSAGDLLNASAGARLGSGLAINPAKTDPASAATAPGNASVQVGRLPEKAPESLGATFANEMIRRMGEEFDADGQPKDVTSLRDSLASTMDWMRERFGDEAAAAAAGMVLQSTSSGITEETMGNGLLNALKFIDRNFGFAAGDAAIANFNSGINSELNDYFDNGKTEIFFASDSMPEAVAPGATQDINARFFMRAVQADSPGDSDEASLNEQLLNSLKAELDKVAELQDLTSQLEAEFNPAKATPEAVIAAYESASGLARAQFADMTV